MTLKRTKGTLIRVHAGHLESGVVYDIEFACSTPGPGIETGMLTGFWTGQIDAHGKLTIKPVSDPDRRDGQPVYLFPDEFVSLTRAA